MSQTVTDADFEAEVLKSEIPVLVDFWAPWCGPCKSMGPIVDELASEYDGKVKIVKMNVDENPERPQQYGVMSIPTFILFKGGEQAQSVTGARTKEDMKQMIDGAL